MLLSGHGVGVVSLVFAVGSAGIIARTFVRKRGMLEVAEHKIEEAQKRDAFVENDEDGDGVPDPPGAAKQPDKVGPSFAPAPAKQ